MTYDLLGLFINIVFTSTDVKVIKINMIQANLQQPLLDKKRIWYKLPKTAIMDKKYEVIILIHKPSFN
jgi:hypothetical protein